MTCVSKVHMRNRVATVVAATVMMVAVVASARPVKLHKKASSTCDTENTYVYPYVSLCDSPAQLSTGYHYTVIFGGELEPEYDEANSTYYVRLADSDSSSGASYMAVATSSSNSNDPISVGSSYYIINSDSQRALQWREEGTDEYFLIEKSVNSSSEGATFTFVVADDILLPCPLIYPPRMCKAYYVMSTPSSYDSSAGWLTYEEEDGVNYIKAAAAGSFGDAPIIFKKSVSTGSATMPFSTIRAVTQ